tara:strand:- start:640 stop:1629 length:990 start_codon:yes stop_codon:yes gene_type:complete
MTKVSIIIPMYNVENYIEKCVCSAYNQDLKETEFEIIAVDDESPDNSLKLISTLAQKHSNIFVVSQKNRGLGGARNTGIKHAKGDYLLFLDADDFYIENTLKKIINVSNENNLDILEFGAQGIDNNGNIAYQVEFKNEQNILSGITYYNTSKSMNSACNKLYNRNYIIENKLFFTEKIYGEDFEFNTRALYLAKRVMAVNLVVAKFLQTEDSITRSNDIIKKRKYINDLITILRRTHKFRLKVENNKKQGHDLFFDKRMTLINIDIFFQMFKYKFPFSEILKTKHLLKKENIFYVHNNVEDYKRNLFRIVFLNFDFFFFRVALSLKKII